MQRPGMANEEGIGGQPGMSRHATSTPSGGRCRNYAQIITLPSLAHHLARTEQVHKSAVFTMRHSFTFVFLLNIEVEFFNN